MNCKKMTHKKASTSDVPKPFRGLRILLVDNDTTSLLQIASVLEDYSYKVTTTELATVALSILQERTDSFDLVIADYNMPEMACFKFIKSVKFINDFPIILIATELQKGIVKAAMTKGACYFLKKPISTKNLKNVWQHVYRTRNYKNPNDGNAEIKMNAADQEAESQGAKIQEKGVLETINLREPENEQVGDNDQIENDIDKNNGDGKRVIRSISTETDGQGDLKRKRTEDKGDWGQSTFARDLEHRKFKYLVGNGTKMEGKEKENLGKKPCFHLNFNEVVRSTAEREADNKQVPEAMKVPNLTQVQTSRVQLPTTELTRETSQPKMFRRSCKLNSTFPPRVDSLGTHIKEHGFEDPLYHKSSNGVDNVLNQSTSLSDSVIRDVRAELPLEFDEFKEFTHSGNLPASFLKPLQATDIKKAQNASEVSLNQRTFSNGLTNVNQDVDSMRDLASFYRLNQNQLYSADAKRVKFDESTKDAVEHRVQEN